MSRTNYENNHRSKTARLRRWWQQRRTISARKDRSITNDSRWWWLGKLHSISLPWRGLARTLVGHRRTFFSVFRLRLNRFRATDWAPPPIDVRPGGQRVMATRSLNGQQLSPACDPEKHTNFAVFAVENTTRKFFTKDLKSDWNKCKHANTMYYFCIAYISNQMRYRWYYFQSVWTQYRFHIWVPLHSSTIADP